MNILNKGYAPVQAPNALPPQLMQNIQQLKQMRSMFNGNMPALISKLGAQNPQMGQIMQMAQGGNAEQMVRQMCAQQGIDFNVFMNALK